MSASPALTRHRRPAMIEINCSTPRCRYLAAAVELAAAEASRLGGADHLAAQVNPGVLARRVGIGRTALYKQWPSRGDLWADLVAYTVHSVEFSRPSGEPWAPDPDSDSMIDQESPEWLETMRNQLNGSAEAAATDPTWVLRAALLAYPESLETAQSRREVETYRLSTLARRIALGNARGRRHFTNPAFGLPQFAAAVWSILDGHVVGRHLWPESALEVVEVDDGHGPRQWLLGSWAYRAMLFGATTVDRDAPPATFVPEPTGPMVQEPVWTPTQRRLLAAGFEQLVATLSDDSDQPLQVLPHLTIDRLARACRVSRQAIYKVWGTRDELLLDVLDTLLEAEHHASADRLEQLLGVARPEGDGRLARETLRPLVGQTVTGLLQAVVAFLPQARRADVHALLSKWRVRNIDLVAGCIEQLPMTVNVFTPRQAAIVLLDMSTGLRRLFRVIGHDGFAGNLADVFGNATAAVLSYDAKPGAR